MSKKYRKYKKQYDQYYQDTDFLGKCPDEYVKVMGWAFFLSILFAVVVFIYFDFFI